MYYTVLPFVREREMVSIPPCIFAVVAAGPHQLKQQLINTEHPVLPRELGCQSLWLVSCASGSFYTQPQNSLLTSIV